MNINILYYLLTNYNYKLNIIIVMQLSIWEQEVDRHDILEVP